MYQVFMVFLNSLCEMTPHLTIIIRPCSLHRKGNMIQCDPTIHIFLIIHEVELRAMKLLVEKEKKKNPNNSAIVNNFMNILNHNI